MHTLVRHTQPSSSILILTISILKIIILTTCILTIIILTTSILTIIILATSILTISILLIWGQDAHLGLAYSPVR